MAQAHQVKTLVSRADDVSSALEPAWRRDSYRLSVHCAGHCRAHASLTRNY